MDKKFKVLMLNGSPGKNGNIVLAFREMEDVFNEQLGLTKAEEPRVWTNFTR